MAYTKAYTKAYSKAHTPTRVVLAEGGQINAKRLFELLQSLGILGTSLEASPRQWWWNSSLPQWGGAWDAQAQGAAPDNAGLTPSDPQSFEGVETPGPGCALSMELFSGLL